MKGDNTLDEATAVGVVEAVMAGASLKDLHGLDDAQMDNLYAFAYQFYEQGRLDDAQRLFHFLCIYDFYNSQYWMGLAAVHQLKRDYAKAVDLYAVAFAQGRKDYRPLFHSGQCQLALGKPGKARLCFEYVLKDSDDPQLKTQAQAGLEALDALRANEKE
ncbi:type III secretion system translocator chaperone SicA [Pseudomonas alkylphenolica]|uniref:type III secretion system translocator chaperone SicA n=1 Tax=Pseudomonas alkylphenolica TaxID=237609 RepID=UPI0018D680BB|nr:type III secretion system translocator chaperone SicA [Pseudomonas alkylphenolica]MBH3427333.1 type III secretion system translocator chaperone SicA [Pseudomonas alkylphenolica]